MFSVDRDKANPCMENWLSHYQFISRFGLLSAFLLLIFLLEKRFPWRRLSLTFSSLFRSRLLTNFSLGTLNYLLVRAAFPLFSLGAALFAQEHKLGLLNNLFLPVWLKGVLGVLALDLLFYFQHRWLHRYKIFWRFHKVHHSDLAVEVSTGLRFHPIEALLMMATKIIGITFLGIGPVAAFIFEIWLGWALFFSHSNIKIPAPIEKNCRRLLVTPSMHRLHHSENSQELNSNFGFCLSIWDKLFGTHRVHSLVGGDKLFFGLEEYRAPKYHKMINLLLLPFNMKHLSVRPIKRALTKFKTPP